MNQKKIFVLNILNEEDKNIVMKKIIDKVGIKTNGMGICFSLPVEDIVRLDIFD